MNDEVRKKANAYAARFLKEREKDIKIFVTGHSMEPFLGDGMYVNINTHIKNLKKGDIVVAINSMNLLDIHRVLNIRRKKMVVVTKGDNCRIFDSEIPIADVIGKVDTSVPSRRMLLMVVVAVSNIEGVLNEFCKNYILSTWIAIYRRRIFGLIAEE